MTQEEAVMKRLTAEEIAELQKLSDRSREALSVPGPLTQRGYDARRAYSEALYGKQEALLAMASRLVEVESALDHLERLDSGQGQRFWELEEIFRKAKRWGWTSPTQKPNDGGRDA